MCLSLKDGPAEKEKKTTSLLKKPFGKSRVVPPITFYAPFT